MGKNKIGKESSKTLLKEMMNSTIVTELPDSKEFTVSYGKVLDAYEVCELVCEGSRINTANYS